MSENYIGVRFTTPRRILDNPILSSIEADIVKDGIVNNVKFYGAKGDGITNDTNALLEAFQSGECVIYVPCGIYIVDYLDVQIKHNLHIILEGTIKGSGNADFLISPVMRVRSPEPSITRYSLQITGNGGIDASLRQNIPNISSGEGLIVRYLDDVLVQGIHFYSGESKTSGFGDSGLDPWACKKVVVDGCFFKGWNDHGIYATGGASTDPDRLPEQLIVTNCFFEECASGDVRCGRDYQGLIVSGNFSKNSGKHVIISGGTAPDEATAFMLSITDNVIMNCDGAGIDIRFTELATGSCVSNNQIYDWSLTGSISAAILLLGASNVSCYGNVIMPRTSTIANLTACTQGIYMNNGTDPAGVVFTAVNNNIFGNTITIFERATAPLNSCITDMTQTAQIYGNLLNASPYDIWINSGVNNIIVGYPRAQRTNTLGFGFGGVYPKSQLDVASDLRVSNTTTPDTRYLRTFTTDVTNAVYSYSPPTNARVMDFRATTDGANTAPTGGNIAMYFRVLAILAMQINEGGGIQMNALPNYADDAAAAADGTLPSNSLYTTTADGASLRIKP